MNLLTRLRLGPRLGFAFAAVIVLTALAVAVAVLQLTRLNDALADIGAARVPRVQALVDIADELNLVARELRDAMLWHDSAAVAAADKTVVDARRLIVEKLDQLDRSIRSAEGRELLQRVRTLREAYLPLQRRALDLAAAGDVDGGRRLLRTEMLPAQNAYIAALDQLKDQQIRAIADSVRDGERSAAQSRLLLAGLLAAVALGSALLAWLITRSITRPLQHAVASAERIAHGDLSEPIAAPGRDETAELLHALAAMQQGLRDVVGRVRAGVESVGTASGQIAAGNLDLSSRTEQQASSLQQTAASMEQLTGTVRQTAENARQANQIAAGASDAAGRGGAVVGEVVATMGRIADSSRRIGEIVGLIDAIAFQTNILALNAAVEAARAGESGRGFAVVAGEVRALAQRSATAAREIKTLISDSVDKVGDGSRLAEQAGGAMREIVQQVQRVSALVGQITHAADEQSTGIGQVNEAVAQMDQVTQQNAALVEEGAAAAGSLKQQADRLSEAVAAFRLQAA